MKLKVKSNSIELESLLYKDNNVLIASIGMHLSKIDDLYTKVDHYEIYDIIFDQYVCPNQHLIISPSLRGYKLERSSNVDIKNHGTIDNFVDMVFCPKRGEITETRFWLTSAVTIDVNLVFDNNSNFNRFKLSYGNIYIR